MKKFLPPIVALLLLTVGAGLIVQPDLSQLPVVSWFCGQSPITMAVVIEETQQRTVTQTGVLLGPTSRAMRTVNKWRMYDKDQVPEGMTQVAKLADPQRLPWIVLLRDKKVVATVELPKTDDELKRLVGRWGGY